MKTVFWIVLAVTFFLLSIIGNYYGRKLEKSYKQTKLAFKKGYGFNTYGIFESIEGCLKFVRLVTLVGGLLAGIAALLSI